MGTWPTEKLSRVLRREGQMRVWYRALAARRPAQTDGAHSSKENRSDAEPLPRPNPTLRSSLASGAVETPLTRQVQRAIARSSGKEDAMDSLKALVHADGEAPTAATFRTLAHSLLRHHVEDRVGKAEFSKLLSASIGTTIERWSSLTEEERICFTNYVARTTERREERGSSFNKLLGFSQEGADNELVAQVEFQMRKSGVTVSDASVTDLMHLDISWSSALYLRDYSRSLHPDIEPPMEMTDRLMGLMTGYKTGIGGSRPWAYALEIYRDAVFSGYDTTLTTHTHALDALWRSADTFHRVQCALPAIHRQFVWEKALAVCQRVRDAKLLVSGDDGCAYAESLLKTVAAAGRWSVAVSLLSNMDITVTDMSYRSLIPTAESFAFVVAACHAAGHAGHGEALWAIFRNLYTPRSLHSEVLSILLQSFRHVLHASSVVGPIVEGLIEDNKGLERTVVVACLQLLSSRRVVTQASRCQLASKLLCFYDANQWPQQPIARKAELQTVFRCCHLIAASEGSGGEKLLGELRRKLLQIFGEYSAEVQWLDDTSIYALQTITDLRKAMGIYKAVVDQRGAECVLHLPIPPRQVKMMFFEALLRYCKNLEDGDERFLLDEDAQEDERTVASSLIEEAMLMIRKMYTSDDTFPHHCYAELLLHQAPSGAQKDLTLEAMRHFLLGSAELVNHRHVSLIAEMLSLTDVHVENALVVGHAALRYTALRSHGGPRDIFSTARRGSVDRALW
uniref:Uncharacterized protein n=1 Tax=Trypanosoma congolense (strain IL3000) TaxID=1068625 RepID=G0UTA8_TRYCI|nr:conserved hypothetical protein [Trypanosoma congolense IL3000]